MVGVESVEMSVVVGVESVYSAVSDRVDSICPPISVCVNRQRRTAATVKQRANLVMLKQLGITAFTMRDIDKFGIAHVMDLAMAQLAPSAEAPLHVSFDIDAVCPTWAPATGTTVAGGLSFREANYVTEAVAETGALGSLDMVEVNPTLGQLHEDATKTADLGNMLITSMLGDSII